MRSLLIKQKRLTEESASQYLVLGAKAKAAMEGRSVPDLDDVRSIADSVLRHRVVLNFQGEAEGLSVSKLIRLEE